MYTRKIEEKKKDRKERQFDCNKNFTYSNAKKFKTQSQNATLKLLKKQN